MWCGRRRDGWCCCTYRPIALGSNPIEMLWRHFRREVTHCELFASVRALLDAATDFFGRYNQDPQKTLSVIGSNAAVVV
jgi:hypothetical protein